MSHSRKHLVAGAVQDYPVPEGEQQIVRVKEMRGGNIVEVEQPNGEHILCLLPAKFKKTLWIKRGNYLIIEPFTEVLNKTDKKLRGRIAAVLYPNHVKNIVRLGLWPPEWAADAAGKALQRVNDESSEDERTPSRVDNKVDEEDEDDPYLVNPNHRRAADSDEEEDDDSDDEEEEDSDEEDDSEEEADTD